MKRTDIDKRFTQEVVSYIAMGYTVSTETMRGTQGEIAKVDLVKGNDFIRILLHEESDHKMYMDKMVLSVGRIPEDKRGWTVWNNDMEVFFTEEWYKLGRRGYYTTRKEAEAAHAKQQARWEAKYEARARERRTYLNQYKPVVVPFVRRQKNCKRVTTTKIDKVYKEMKNGKWTYYVEAKNRTFKMA